MSLFGVLKRFLSTDGINRTIMKIGPKARHRISAIENTRRQSTAQLRNEEKSKTLSIFYTLPSSYRRINKRAAWKKYYDGSRRTVWRSYERQKADTSLLSAVKPGGVRGGGEILCQSMPQHQPISSANVGGHRGIALLRGGAH